MLFSLNIVLYSCREVEDIITIRFTFGCSIICEREFRAGDDVSRGRLVADLMPMFWSICIIIVTHRVLRHSSFFPLLILHQGSPRVAKDSRHLEIVRTP